MASRKNNCIHRGIVRDATGFRLFSNEWFDTSDVSAANSVALGHIPCLDLDLVEVWTTSTDGFIEVFPNSANGGYTLTGSRDMQDRYLVFGSGWTFPVGDTDVIHLSYGIKSLTVNTEISLTTGDIAFNVDASYSDSSGATQKGLVDSGRYQLTSISKVAGQILTPDNWTNDFRQMTINLGSLDAKSPWVNSNLTSVTGQVLTADNWTNDFRQMTVNLGSIDAKAPFVQANLTSVSGLIQTPSDWTLIFNNLTEDTGNISISLGQIYTKLQNISGSVGGISTSLGNIDLDLDITNAKLIDISGSVGGISLSLGSIDLDLDITNARLLNISGSVGGISLSLGSIDTKLNPNNIIGQIKISDGITIASIDTGTNAILVKEVTGASEIASVNITSVSGEIQTPSDWTNIFNNLTEDTGNISISVGQIAGYTNGISISLGSIDAKLPFTQTNLTSISGTIQTAGDWTAQFQNISSSVGGISLSLGSIDIDLDTTNARLLDISGSVGGISLSLGSIDGKITLCNTGAVVVSTNVYPTNATSWTTGQVLVPNPGTAVQLPSVIIATGCTGTIKAMDNNTGTISVGDIDTKALSTSTGHYKLLPGNGISLGVTNLNKIYMDAWVANEGIEYFTEAT